MDSDSSHSPTLNDDTLKSARAKHPSSDGASSEYDF